MHRIECGSQGSYNLWIRGHRDMLSTQLGKRGDDPYVECNSAGEHDLRFEANTCRQPQETTGNRLV